jgi:hypothetical protein
MNHMLLVTLDSNMIELECRHLEAERTHAARGLLPHEPHTSRNASASSLNIIVV